MAASKTVGGFMTKLIFAAATALLAISATPSFAQVNSEAGILRCRYGTNVGMIVGSRQTMACVFTKGDKTTENYTATFTRVGLDVGITAGGRLAWTVLSTNPKGLPPRALTGNYVGASADASFGVGAGANALVGGSKKSITLQPLSVEGQVGVNLALGAAKFRLR
jgi:hypothetical protein